MSTKYCNKKNVSPINSKNFLAAIYQSNAKPKSDTVYQLPHFLDLIMNTKPLTRADIEINTRNLIHAIYNNDIDEIKLLIPVSNPKENCSYALRAAAECGCLQAVELLIPVSDSKDTSDALRMAAEAGHAEIVKLLLPVSDPKTDNSEALYWAVQEGHTDIVQLLIPVSDPKAENNSALRIASQKGHWEIVNLLLPVSDYYDVLQTADKTNHNTIKLRRCIEKYEAFQQKTQLNKAIENCWTNKNNSIKRKI